MNPTRPAAVIEAGPAGLISRPNQLSRPALRWGTVAATLAIGNPLAYSCASVADANHLWLG